MATRPMEKAQGALKSIWAGVCDLAAGKVRYIPPEDRKYVFRGLMPEHCIEPDPVFTRIEGVSLEFQIPLGLNEKQFLEVMHHMASQNLPEPERADFHFAKLLGKTDEATRRYRIAAFTFKGMIEEEQERRGRSAFYAARHAHVAAMATGHMASADFAYQ